ncbi:FtsX-like permease family protein [Lachnospiraceae bacterium ZAX-1]
MNLFKKLLRDIIKSKGQFITITFVVILGALFYSGLSSASVMLDDYAKEYYEKNNLADIWMYYSNITEEDSKVLDDVAGIEDYELRFTYQSRTDEKTLKIHSFHDNSNINKLYLVEGNLPENPYEIAVDYEFAKANALKLNQDLDYTVDGIDVTYKVTAFIENPEYITKIPEDGNNFPEHDRYGIGYVNYSTIPELSKLTGISVEYDEIIVTAKSGTDLGSLMNTIEKELEDSTPGYLFGYTKDFYPGYSMLKGDIEQFRSLSYVFPVIFFVVAALMTYIAMKRIIDTQRKQIGIMKALGVKRAKITGHYLGFPIIPCALGGVLGGICGSILLPGILLEVYSETYDLPGIHTRVIWSLVLPAVILAVVIGMIASYLSCRKSLKENAAISMRPLIPKSGKKILFERNKKLWNRLKGKNKIVLRNIFCNKKRAIMSCVGVMGSVALMITGFAMKDSTKALIDRTYEEIYKYDGVVNFSFFTSEKGKVKYTDPYRVEIPEGIETNYVSTLGFEMKNEDNITFGSIVALEDNHDFYRVIDSNVNELDIPDEGFIISKRLADTYNIKIGDEIELKLTDSIYGGGVVDGKVMAVSEQYLSQEIYCSPGFLENKDLELKPLTMYIKTLSGTSIDKVKDFYKDIAEVESVISRDEQKQSVLNYTKSMDAIVGMMIIGAMLLSFAVIYNISVINIMERSSTLATMKVLGFGRKKVASIFEVENLLLTLIGVIGGIPLGILFMKTVFDSAATDDMSFPYIVTIVSIIISCALAFVYTLLSDIPVRRKIKKVNMTESLKVAE